MRVPPVVVAVLLLPAFAGTAEARHSGWKTASEVGRGVLAAVSLGMPTLDGDWNGALQSAGSMAVAKGATWGLKQTIHAERPDRSGNDSFPSGHTSVSFAAAANLENRYGWQVGLPAFALASVVGVARVEARKHHWYDAVAGGAIGTASGFLLTRKLDPDVRLVPWADSSGGGLTLALRY